MIDDSHTVCMYIYIHVYMHVDDIVTVVKKRKKKLCNVPWSLLIVKGTKILGIFVVSHNIASFSRFSILSGSLLTMFKPRLIALNVPFPLQVVHNTIDNNNQLQIKVLILYYSQGLLSTI